MQYSESLCCFGPYWLSLYYTNVLQNILFCVLQEKKQGLELNEVKQG